MPNCEAPQCNERATKILSVGSLGRVESLCERHVADAVRTLEPNLIPFHLTGIDAPFTGEESLGERVAVLDTERAKLSAELDEARHENMRLTEILLARLEDRNDELRREVALLHVDNSRLIAELASHGEKEPVTRVD
jgi:hypothetical protein